VASFAVEAGAAGVAAFRSRSTAPDWASRTWASTRAPSRTSSSRGVNAADTPAAVGPGATDAVAIGDGVAKAPRTADGKGTVDAEPAGDALDCRIPLASRYPPMAAATARTVTSTTMSSVRPPRRVMASHLSWRR